MDTTQKPTPSPNESAETESSHPLISRRQALMAGTSLLALSAGGLAWGQALYATNDNARVWEKPTINFLNQDSNLFKPGDRPREDIVATCSSVNTSYTRGTSRAYWGCDVGLEYVSDDQRDWPLRSHAFGNDTFSRTEAASNAWTDRWKDTISGATLTNNAGGCGRAGYGAHHLVSFAIWDIAGFGGIIPTSIGAWSLHNVSGLTWGTYGRYQSPDYSGGARPPDETTVFPGASAFARITCFSVEPEADGADYRLHYCLYGFFNFTDIGISVGRAFDNYAGLAFAWATAAGIRCEVTHHGLGDIASILLDNVNRGFAHRSLDEPLVESLIAEVESGQKTVPVALETALGGIVFSQWYSDALEAAKRLIFVLFQRPPATAQEATILASRIERRGCGCAARIVLDEASHTLPYPLSRGRYSVSISEGDVAGDAHTISLGTDGQGATGRVYNYGTYTGRINDMPNGWSLDGDGQAQVTIPDNGSGAWFPLAFSVSPAAYPEALDLEVTVTFRRDAPAARELGLESLCHTERTPASEIFHPSEEADAAGKRPGCTSWRGWYLDEGCTVPYTPQALDEDTTLYCVNTVTASWGLSANASSLEARYAGALYADEGLSSKTTLSALLPTSSDALWGSTYSSPRLPSVWWRQAEATRGSDGAAYYDAQSSSRFEGMTRLLKDTTFFGDWGAPTFDGVTAS